MENDMIVVADGLPIRMQKIKRIKRRKRFNVGDYITQIPDGDIIIIRKITQKYNDGTYGWVYPFGSEEEYYSCNSSDPKMCGWKVISQEEAEELNLLVEKFKKLYPDAYLGHYTQRQAKWQSFINNDKS